MNFQTTFSAKKEDGSAKSFNILQNERKIKQERRGKKMKNEVTRRKRKSDPEVWPFFQPFCRQNGFQKPEKFLFARCVIKSSCFENYSSRRYRIVIRFRLISDNLFSNWPYRRAKTAE